jgi:hypothetical protein
MKAKQEMEEVIRLNDQQVRGAERQTAGKHWCGGH